MIIKHNVVLIDSNFSVLKVYHFSTFELLSLKFFPGSMKAFFELADLKPSKALLNLMGYI